MDANKILTSDILDIVFDGRNKSYGAYQLRKGYEKTLKRALILTMSAILLVFLIYFFAGVISDRMASTELDVLDTELADINQDEPPPPPPPPPTPPPPPEVNQVKFTPPKIVKDEEVKPDEKIEEIKEEQVISTQTIESENTNQIVQAPIDDQGSKVVEAPGGDDENKIFNKVEVEAAFPGGEQAWVRYLRKNLDPNVPIDNGAPEGTYQVIIRFIVSKEGAISDVQSETSHGYGMEQEAMKIIRKGPKWTPALQNGRNVNAYRRQPITFVVQEQ